MAQDNDSNPPPAASSDSMSPGKDSNGPDRSESSSRLVVNNGINKGKGVIKTEATEEDCRSTGKNITPQVIATAPGDGRSGGRRRRGDRELHIVTERQRRKRMSQMFTKLQGLLPPHPDKVDKSTIVMDAIHYIKSLEGTLSELENRKMEMELAQGKPGVTANDGVSSAAPVALATPLVGLSAGGVWPTVAAGAPAVALGAVTAAPTPVGLQTWSGPNVVLSLSGNDACINMHVAPRSGALTMVLAVLEKYGIDVMASGISSDRSQCMFTIQARINGGSTQFGNNVASEDIYKLAVSEIMVWLSE